MTTTTAAQEKVAERLLRRRGALRGTAEERSAAAARVYATLVDRLSPLIGEAGFAAVFARSVKLATVRHACLGEIAEGIARGDTLPVADQLAGCLSKLAPDDASRAATDLYATLFALLTSFIGERLVLRVLESAFPEAEDMSKETE